MKIGDRVRVVRLWEPYNQEWYSEGAEGVIVEDPELGYIAGYNIPFPAPNDPRRWVPVRFDSGDYSTDSDVWYVRIGELVVVS